MRKVSGVLFAVAMMLPLGLMASPAGAAGGTTCKPASGTVKLSPGLTTTAKVQTITINLPVSGCVGGGVTGGVFKGSLKTTAISIKTFAAGGPPLKLNATITWNNKKTSTLVATSTTKIAKTITSTVNGKISKGLFVGLTFKSAQTVSLGKPGAGGAITTLNIKGTGAVTIK